MKSWPLRIAVVLFAMAVLAAGCGDEAPNPPQVPATPPLEASPSPKQVLEAYKSALHDDHARLAASFLSANTIAHFEKLRVWSLKLSRGELENLDEMDVGQVLALRHLYRKRRLAGATVASLMRQNAAGRKRTMALLDTLQIKEVKIEGRVAIASLNQPDGTQGGVVLKFLNENGDWKLDLNHFGRQSQGWYGPYRKKLGLSKVNFALHLLRLQFGKDKVTDAIADGPLD